MKIRLITMGKTTNNYLKEGISIYLSRLKHYTNFSILELDEIKGSKKTSMDEYRKMEASKLKAVINAERIVLLDEKGKSFTSFAFAKKINTQMINGVRSLDFVIGGPFGFDEEIYNMSHEQMSLSEMTFSHQMVRLIFVEQLYRAMTILKGEPYHHK